ncbi:MAG: ATP-binding protein, partial [Mycobacteriales bacterium]
PTDVVDAHRFSELVKLGQASLSADDAAAARRTLTAALELWRGPALADAAGAAYVAAPAARLEELRLTAIESRAWADLRLGQFDAAVGELTALVTDHPLRETGAALLIEALDSAGRPADALGQYGRIRAALADELGIDPSPKLREAHLMVLRRTAEPAGPHRPDRLRQPLRSSFTSFIGRAEEIDGIERKLAVSRLVTLVGPGGAGKTRLSIEAGERVALDYRDGVHLIELAPVTNADYMPRVVLGRLGMRESNLLENPQRASHRDVLTQLADALRDKQTLLLFDNCEHLIEPVARLVELLLANSPGLRVVATSREPLAIFGEAVHLVPPLGQPSADASPADALESHAVQLFADRAASVRDSPSTTGRSRRWWRSAADSTVCRWPSSWPPPGCGPCRLGTSPSGSATDFGCSMWVAERRCRATRLCEPSSSGAGTC